MKANDYLNKLLQQVEGKKELSYRFHTSSNNKAINTKSGLNNVPDSWIKIHFKTYPRLNMFTLPKSDRKESSIVKLLKKRESARKFNVHNISIKDLSQLLYYSGGLVKTYDGNYDKSRRSYPSAGARYPLEIYPLIIGSDELRQGLYHYNVKENKLEFVKDFNISKWIDKAINEEWIKQASVIFIITGILDRTLIKYGDRGYRYALIEVGHLSQNLILLATEMSLKTCLVGGFVDTKVVELLDLKLVKEVPLYMIAVGK